MLRWTLLLEGHRRSPICWCRPGGCGLRLRPGLVACFCVALFAWKASAGFITAPTYDAGRQASSIVVDDFNADGIPDLAVAGGSGVSILLGNGDASFQAPRTYVVGAEAISLAAGDFNGDGHLDLLVANYTYEGSVNTLLGNGDGSFQIGESYAVGSFLTAVAVGDFNGDGIPDVAVASSNTNSVIVLLGNGDGSFQISQSFPVDGQPNSVAVGDFNGDGFLDLAVAKSTLDKTVAILLGNGDGSFQPAQSYDVGFYPYSVTVGDFNNDGIPDLAVADHDFSGHAVAVLLGNGDGTFQAVQSFDVGSGPISIAAGDFNSDGRLDLAVASQQSCTVSVLLGNGDGTFQPSALSYALDTFYPYLAVGDFNGDGHFDLAVADGSAVAVFQGRGDGTFQAGPLSYAPGGESAVVGDFNNDGQLDFAVTGADSDGDGQVTLYLGNGDGSFQAARSYAALLGILAAADFNGDGKLDLVTSGGSLFLGNGDGTFQDAQDLGASGSSIAVADFNRDGIPDLALVIPDGSVGIFLGNGDGTFQAGQTYLVKAAHGPLAVGDFNGDGLLDLAVLRSVGSNSAEGTVSILLGNGDGTFQEAGSFAAGLGLKFLTVGDFNGDGKDDLVTTNFAYDFNIRPYRHQVVESDVHVFSSNGDGTFQPAQTYPITSGYPIAVAVGDFNRDGIPDLLVADGGFFYFPGSTVSVLLGMGDGTFQPAQAYGAGGYPSSVAVGDFNGDGYPDVVVGNTLSPSMVTVLLNAADWGR